MKKNQTTEVASSIEVGVFIATVIVVLSLSIIFFRAPISYYLGKWNGYWSQNTAKSTSDDTCIKEDLPIISNTGSDTVFVDEVRGTGPLNVTSSKK